MKSGFPLSIFKNFKCCLYIFLKRPYLIQQNTVIHWVKTNWTKYHLNRIANKIFRQEELNKNHLFLTLHKNQIHLKKTPNTWIYTKE